MHLSTLVYIITQLFSTIQFQYFIRTNYTPSAHCIFDLIITRAG